METAVSLVMDGRPLIGERVAVIGQGVIGLLTAALLRCFPLGRLATFDRFRRRRRFAVMGADESFDPILGADSNLAGTFDVCFELTGAPAGLDQAIRLAGFDGRVVIGSWYGQKRAELDLGGRFHRSRIRLISSQVSSLAPELSGRWRRNAALAWPGRCCARCSLLAWITHRIALQDAQAAYQLIDQRPEEVHPGCLTYL